MKVPLKNFEFFEHHEKGPIGDKRRLVNSIISKHRNPRTQPASPIAPDSEKQQGAR